MFKPKMDQNKERKMNKVNKFGENVEGYNIPVLNEREIRASAGILFIFMFFSWMLVIFKDSFFLMEHWIKFASQTNAEHSFKE